MRWVYKIISGLLTLLAALACISFAVGNRAPTIIQLWPFGFEVALPIYLVAMVPLLLGLLAGGLLFWALHLPKRYQAKNLAKENERQRMLINRLKEELAEAKSNREGDAAGSRERWQLPVPWL
jgi:uncharacterized integral membrane protein